MSDTDIEARYAALRNAPVEHSTPIVAFGRRADGYDLGGPDGEGEPDYDEPTSEDEDLSGCPGRDLVRDCMLLWAAGWRRFDVETAAVVFNMDQALVREVAPDPSDFANIDPLTRDEFGFGHLVQFTSSCRDQYISTEAPGEQGEFIPSTVAEVAAVLNAKEADVAAAVEEHYWMFLGEERDGSPTIEHEGE